MTCITKKVHFFTTLNQSCFRLSYKASKTMADLNIEELIFRQLKNNLSVDEETNLLEWFHASEANQKIYADYCVLFKSREIESVKPYFENNKERAWSHFVDCLQEKQRGGLWNVIKIISRYAAIVVIAFSMGAGTLWLLNPEQEQLVQSIEIPLGSKSRITLPDGSKVWLNSGSKLTYENNFGKKNRTLTLDGEGCFDVTKNENLPFEVYSGDVRIKVLGTKFNMKSYSEDENTRVTLIEGSLNVATGLGVKEGKTIIPNQQVIINKRLRQLVVKNVNAFNYVLWTEAKKEEVIAKVVARDKKLPDMIVPNTTLRNVLFFDEEPLNQIIRDLERAFNVSIELREEKIGKEKFYGDFRNEETIYDIMKIITMNSDLKYDIVNNKILIYK